MIGEPKCDISAPLTAWHYIDGLLSYFPPPQSLATIAVWFYLPIPTTHKPQSTGCQPTRLAPSCV